MELFGISVKYILMIVGFALLGILVLYLIKKYIKPDLFEKAKEDVKKVKKKRVQIVEQEPEHEEELPEYSPEEFAEPGSVSAKAPVAKLPDDEITIDEEDIDELIKDKEDKKEETNEQ